MCAKLKDNSKSIIGSLLFIAAIAGFIYTLRFTGGFDIWYDEVFSLSFIKYSLRDIIHFTARDVHPPLYYFYLKLITGLVTGIFGKGSIYSAAKLASCLPWIGLLVLSFTYIRKRFSNFTAGLFMFLITLMPQIATYYLEIRMYSFALLLITGHILVADRILASSEEKAPGKGLWFLFFLLGIMTAYTQYYACIATIGIYLGCGIYALFLKKGNENKKKILMGVTVCVLLSVAAYLPWLKVLKTQMENISGKYWIQPLTIRSIAGCVKFITLPVVYAGKLPIISAGLIILAMAVYFFCWLYRSFRKKNSEQFRLFMEMLLPLITVICSGFILSIMGTPIFIYRYMIPALGGFWLFFAIAADRVTDEKGLVRAVSLLLIIPFILAGTLSFKGFYDEEAKKLYEETDARIRVDSIPTGSVIITNFDHVTAVMGFYRPDCEVYLYEAEIDKLLPDMLESIRDDARDETVLSLLDSGRSVYFYGSFNSREEIVADWQEQGVNSALLDSILIERYWINVYELHK